jgi:hypothetical protein
MSGSFISRGSGESKHSLKYSGKVFRTFSNCYGLSIRMKSVFSHSFLEPLISSALNESPFKVRT